MRRTLSGLASSCAVRLLLPATLTLGASAGCQGVYLLSEAEANEMGAQAFQEMLAQADLSANPSQKILVERVGRRIAEVTDRRMAAEGRDRYQWEFKVIEDTKTANAFALPGGKVAVYTGILPLTQDEDGLAVVLGHEVAHAYLQHGRERVSQQIIAQFGFAAVEAFLGGDQSSDTSKLAMAALGVGYQVGVALPFSRSDESEADAEGLLLMAEAGYDPRTAVPFWQRMAAAGGGGGIEFLSTHPLPDTRIDRIRELLPEALRVYEARSSASEP